MLCVGLPEKLYQTCEVVNYDQAERVQNALYHSYNIEVLKFYFILTSEWLYKANEMSL